MSVAPEQASKPSGDWSRLLPNKVVVVTGAGGAIGSAIAHSCLLHGARVVIADINKNAAEGVAAKLISEDDAKKDDVMVIELDVTNEQAIQNAMKSVVDKWNTIDVPVNKYVNCLIIKKSLISFF
jgi:NAD(P)-dependent dehydrogenase (short-subunit alcohol dehydrogenase family)